MMRAQQRNTRSRLALALGMLLPSCHGSAAADYESTLAALTRDLPAEVAELVHRVVDCNHWGGEEGYDDQRAAEIDAAMTALRCDALAEDEAAMRLRHAASPAVPRALDAARDLLF